MGEYPEWMGHTETIERAAARSLAKTPAMPADREAARKIAEGVVADLGEAQRKIVLHSRAQSETDTPYRCFKHIASHSGVSLEEVKPAARELRKLGVMQFGTGLQTDDGEMYGSGYALTDDLGLVVRTILQEQSHAG